jgi:hypothetical protein
VRGLRLLRTRNPRTFNEKVRYKLLRDRRPLIVTFADKAAVRKHVRERVGDGHLPRLLLLSADPSELRDAALPDAFVLKPTHGSGACVVVDPAAPSDSRLPPAQWGWVYSHVRPEHADREALVAIAAGWLAKTYGRGPNHEWAYGRVRPRVLVEELLGGGIPQDVKLFVFHGRCSFVEVDGSRFGERTQDFFDREWNHLALRGGHPNAPVPPVRPERLDEVIALAERLGAGTDFVRVDTYLLADRVVIGELTSAPAGGDSPFQPESWNAAFGAPWTVPRRYES